VPLDSYASWESAMRRGDFEAAWRETDRIEILRRTAQKCAGFVREANHLEWNGEPFEDRDVLVRCGHGLGDALQFVRYVPLIRRVAKSVTLLAPPVLLPLLRATPELGDVRDGWSFDPPAHAVSVEVMELAYAFRSTVDTLPRDVPYLSVDGLRTQARGLPPIPRDGTLRVGLAWSASAWDDTRSIPLESLEPLAKIPRVSFYSLQQGSQAAAYSSAPFRIEPYSRHTQAIELAAAAMLDLDLIITIDSMVAHLAGALGRPVWVLLKSRADWRWFDDGEDSPWYPTMRLVRQRREGEWRGAAETVARMLREIAR
jgi:hypothetical protein